MEYASFLCTSFCINLPINCFGAPITVVVRACVTRVLEGIVIIEGELCYCNDVPPKARPIVMCVLAGKEDQAETG